MSVKIIPGKLYIITDRIPAEYILGPRQGSLCFIRSGTVVLALTKPVARAAGTSGPTNWYSANFLVKDVVLRVGSLTGGVFRRLDLLQRKPNNVRT